MLFLVVLAFSDTAAFCERYGYPLGQTLNTIIVVGKGRVRTFAACVVSGTMRLDVNHTVRKLLGVRKASFASADVMRELTGVRSFQIATGAARRPRTWKRTFAYVFQSVSTLRFELIHQPARLVRPAGRPQLRFAVSPRARSQIERCQRAIERLAA